MPTYRIRGINVDFPHEAYDCQLVYMEKVIQSLQEKSNALLESPTGTGKTLCLLCATLAWRKSLGAFSRGRIEKESQFSGSSQSEVPSSQSKANSAFSRGRMEKESQFLGSSQSEVPSSQSKANSLPTIVYTSRTHSQIRQVIQELKRTNYRPKMVVLGSREQLCIHEKVSLLHGSAQTNACHYLLKKRTNHYCGHYQRVADFLKTNPALGDEPIDIEDMVNIGRSCGPCPYYISRDLHKTVDILFAPYNYLIEHRYRKSLQISWENSILIFDEAHNLESLCADAASFDLPTGLLTACISEAKKCIDLSISRKEVDNSNEKAHKPDNYAILRALLLKLDKRISEVRIESKELGFTRPGPYMYELLGDLNITHETADMLIGIIEDAAVLLEEDANITGGGPQKVNGTVCRLESMGGIFRTIFRDGGKGHAEYYRVHVQEAEKSETDFSIGKRSRILSWWCFNPGFTMEEFARLDVGSIILTSGTLSPLDSFAQELKLKFPIRLENPHVISENQIWAGVIPAGPSGYTFNSSYRTRDSVEYKQELGNAIVNFARIVPDGLLVFFPSYYFLDQCIGCWKADPSSSTSNSIWERICKHKQPVVEPRQASLFSSSIEDYMTKLKDTSTSGAVFFAVCRGKVSEGLDFADRAGRAVIITGIPFATRNDPKVRLKREYLDQQAQTNSQLTGCRALTGEEWYSQQATRAVNQAVGRVIRHHHDYGAIIFCDERFAIPNRQSQISLWIQPHIKSYSKFGDVVFTLTRFFRSGGGQGLSTFKKLQDKDSREIKTDDKFEPEGLSLASSNLSTLSQGNVSTEETSKVSMEKFFTSLQASRANKELHAKSILPPTEMKRGSFSRKLEDIVPANRSSLSSSMTNQSISIKRSSDIYHSKKLRPGVKNVQPLNNEIIDLTTDSSLEENPCGQELIIPCSSKKPRLLKEELDPSQLLKSSNGYLSLISELQPPKSVKPDKLQISASRNEPNVEVCSEVGSAEDKADGYVDEKNKAIMLNPATNHGDESKGTAFLIQVKDKLTDAEYQEFVGFMKALKSKAMKIGQVLKSIINLFSSSERLPLLSSFKGYIPAKYHSLYEHLTENVSAVGSASKHTPLCVVTVRDLSLYHIANALIVFVTASISERGLPVSYTSRIKEHICFCR